MKKAHATTMMVLIFLVISCAQASDAGKKEGRLQVVKKSECPLLHTDKEDGTGYVEMTREEWKEILDPETFRVTRKKGTEPAFSGQYDKFHESGIYICANCGNDLYASETKFDSRTGWPSFYEPIAPQNIREKLDIGLGLIRTEILCARCGAHLGHVFKDGPRPTGLRYCMNSVSLKFCPQNGSPD
ncbi:MAG: peptide-methionine (R)-S-oxide reductase MsrB [Pseudomonadota bacterium]